jgi:polyadenylate-binding protein
MGGGGGGRPGVPVGGGPLGGGRGPVGPPPPSAASSQHTSLAQNVIDRLKNAPDRAAQRNILGDLLFPLVQQTQVVKETNPLLAGKITGMLLEMDAGEVINLLEDKQQLVSKISEAVTVLKQNNYVR